MLASFFLLAIAIYTVTQKGARAQTPPTPKTLASNASSARPASPRGKKTPPPPPASASAAPAPAAPTGAQKVTVGIYVHHVNQVDLRANSFLADFYVWFKWKGDIDPTKTFELRNAVEQWQIVKVPAYTDGEGTASPLELPDGTKYQIFRMEARFGRPFSVHHYPLDEQDLLIEVEEATSLVTELDYDVDPESTIDPKLIVPGWNVAKSSTKEDTAFFATTFGDPRVKKGEDAYPRVTLTIHLVRPTAGMLVKTIVPLTITILITFAVFLVDPHLVDARLALTVTALVSAIALHFSTSTELPEVGYLVLLDKVYILSYVVILMTTCVSAFVARLCERGRQTDAIKYDRIAGVACFVLFFGGTALILLWR